MFERKTVQTVNIEPVFQMMETAFYDDFSAPHNFHPSGMNNTIKRKLTLDLNLGAPGDLGAGKGSVIKKAKVASLNTPVLLSTPDVAMCKLGTPDLERAIVQQYSSLPTPNIAANQIFFNEMNETAEKREISAEFEQALNTVRSQHEKNVVTTTMSDIIPTTISSVVKIKKDPMLSDSMMIPTSMSIPTTAVAISGASPLLMNQQATYLQIGQPVAPPAYYEDSDLSQDDTENSCSTTSSTFTNLSSGMNNTVLLLNNNNMPNHLPFPVTSANNVSLPHKLPDYGSTVTSAGGVLRLPVSNDLYTLTSVNNSLTSVGSSVPNSLDYPSVSSSPNMGLLSVKEEPQTVPSVTSSPPVSPIDMETQEKIKLERKRQRNRVAASKCRQRKLERINKLETKVKQLKGENAELTNLMSKLKDHVYQLRQQLNSHVKSGCQIMMPSGMNSF